MLDNTGVFFVFALPALILLGCPCFFIPFYFLKKKNTMFKVLYWVFFIPWILLIGLVALIMIAGRFVG